MTLIAYARVSTTGGQNLDLQEQQLRAAGAEKLFMEQKSGTTVHGRQALAEALEWGREGDVLLVTRLDRLARSMGDLHAILTRLDEKKVGLRVLQQAEIDTTTSTGRLTLNMVAAFAVFENELRRERQAEGIAKAKQNGVYRGRRPSISAAKVVELQNQGLGATEIAAKLGIARASVYRLAGQAASQR